MKIKYADSTTQKTCEDLKAAKKHFGGNALLAKSLLARINALEQAPTIKDIIVQPAFHFHNLENKYGRKLKGLFAIDVKSRRDPWRIILQPLDENESPYDPCRIDEIAEHVRIIEISEVSQHYE